MASLRNHITVAVCLVAITAGVGSTINEFGKTAVAKAFEKSSCVGNKITVDNYETVLKKTDALFVSDPFSSGNCVAISLKKSDKNELSEDDFDNERIYDYYKEFLSSQDTKVSQTVSSDNKVYKFLKYTIDKSDFNLYALLFKSKKLLNAHIEDIAMLGNLMSLNEQHTDKNLTNDQSSAVNDIGAVIVISAKYGFDINQTMKLFQELTHARKVNSKINKDIGFEEQIYLDGMGFFKQLSEKGINVDREFLKGQNKGLVNNGIETASDIAFSVT